MSASHSQLHLLLPCILSCCVGKTLSNAPVEDHWRLRDLAATIVSDVNRKCVRGEVVSDRHGSQYPKMQRQIFVTLNKVLHNPKTTLPSVYGAVRCNGGRRVGRRRARAWRYGGGRDSVSGVP